MSLDSTHHQKAVDLAKLTYEATGSAGSGHPSTGASLAHLLTALLYGHMRHEPANPGHPSSDRLVLSEGHAVPIVYAAMADLGIHYKSGDDLRPVTRELLMTLRDIDSPIDGHPNPGLGMPFFDAATGSLGQGLSVAAGLAIAAKLDGLDKRIFCIIGDGESREGQIWEAVDFIRDHDLKAVLPIFNANTLGQTSEVSPQQSADVLVKKLEAAGYTVLDIDGHTPTAIVEALATHAQHQHEPGAAPVALVARTVKGWGSASQQGNGHHGTAPTGDALAGVLEELEATARSVGAAADTPLKIPMMSADKPAAPDEAGPAEFRRSPQGRRHGKRAGKRQDGHPQGLRHRIAGRRPRPRQRRRPRRRGQQLHRRRRVQEGRQALAERFVECRIAEQNMVSAGLGLSAAGKVPFISTFGKFMVRAYDQIEMALLSNRPLKLVGSHAGATLGPDGPSQMALVDVPFFRAFTTMRSHDGHRGAVVVTPSDAYACYALVQQMAEYSGTVYLRTLRPDTEFIYGPDDTFVLGGHEVLVEGRDLLICASGYMVHEVNKAIEQLDEAGVDATVVDLYSLPFDGDAIADLANNNHGKVLTVEDNYGGGMGSAVAEVLAATGDGFDVQQMHVQYLPKSGQNPDELLQYCKLSADHIVAKALEMLSLTPA